MLEPTAAMQHDTTIINISTLNAKKTKALEKAKKKALQDFDKRQKIDKANRLERGNSVVTPLLTTPPEFKPVIKFAEDMKPLFKVGQYVKVARDYSPGNHRQEGYGFVSRVSGVGPATLCTVKNGLQGDARSYNDVPLTSITTSTFGAEWTRSTAKRKREDTPQGSPCEAKQKVIETRMPIDILVEKLVHGARHKLKRGWYLNELRKDSTVGSSTAVNNKPYLSRLSREEEERLWNEIQLLEIYIKLTKLKQHKKVNGMFKPTTTSSKGTSLIYLCETAYGRGKMYLSRLKKKVASKVAQGNGNGNGNDNDDEYFGVIENRMVASKFYCAKRLYAINKCRQALHNYEDKSRKLHDQRMKTALAEYDGLPKDIRNLWDLKEREHNEEQPNIKYRIVDALKANPKVSWLGLERTIDYWCGATSIWRWVTSFAGYKCYCERVIPNLTEEQKRNHLKFAKRFRNNWGLGSGKYLLLMYDEKWFWGLVTRRGAKCCDELGVGKKSFKVYHKNHINKTMGIAFTAFAFVDSLENGGSAEKLAFVRAQGKKVADRLVREAVKQPDGRVRYCGKVVRKKGDVYNVDCAVTGSSSGSVADPKCPLLPIFHDHVFPKVKDLVGPGGKYEGYTPVFQGDNAGPHQDATFLNAIKSYCAENGWHWEPQAAQMPHMNVLDLSVFPCMSRRHTEKCRNVGGLKVLSEDEIWDNAMKVWNELPSCRIGSSYVQAFRIAQKIIKAKGNNDFLGAGSDEGIHSGIRKDFLETKDGLRRIDRKHVNAQAPDPM